MLSIFKPNSEDKNKIFRNVMLSVLFFYFIITIIMIFALFKGVEFKQFESYFMSLSTVLVAAMTNYFYFASKQFKEKP